MIWRICSRSYCTVFIVLLVLTSGCTAFRPDLWYLHNETNNVLMQQVETEWSAFTDSESGFWPTLARNQEKIAEAEILAQQALSAGVSQTRHVKLLSSTWQDLLEEAEQMKKQLESDQKAGSSHKKGLDF